MKKVLLMLIGLFALNIHVKSQTTFHNAYVTRLYFVDSADNLLWLQPSEIWMTVDDSAAVSGFSNHMDMYYTIVDEMDLTGVDNPVIPEEERLSCAYARWLFGKSKVSCLPWIATGGCFLCGYCGNSSLNDACAIDMGNGVVQIAPDGDFKF
ncbi:MAG TPA: hypothetical protein VD905_19720 [Flavobacteriales bacterium]|nr:hypothetical protein [Flavobacteriales bacterium]